MLKLRRPFFSVFEEFLSVSSRLKKSTLVSSPARYSEVKELAKDYQIAKNQVHVCTCSHCSTDQFDGKIAFATSGCNHRTNFVNSGSPEPSSLHLCTVDVRNLRTCPVFGHIVLVLKPPYGHKCPKTGHNNHATIFNTRKWVLYIQRSSFCDTLKSLWKLNMVRPDFGQVQFSDTNCSCYLLHILKNEIVLTFKASMKKKFWHTKQRVFNKWPIKC